jgi:hypothetical protein
MYDTTHKTTPYGKLFIPRYSSTLGIVYTQTKNFGLFGLSGHLKFIFCVFLCRLSRGRKEAYLSSVLSVLFFLFCISLIPIFFGALNYLIPTDVGLLRRK